MIYIPAADVWESLSASSHQLARVWLSMASLCKAGTLTLMTLDVEVTWAKVQPLIAEVEAANRWDKEGA